MSEDLPEIQRSVATKILAHAQAKEKSFSFDPFTIMAICNCIISVVKLLYMCYSSESVAKAVKSNSILHRLLLKREIRKQFKDKRQRKALIASFTEAGASLSETELSELVESIRE